MKEKEKIPKLKGKTRRSQSKFPALNPRLNIRIRQEEIDFDYLDKLTPIELDWLNRFMEEYNNASFNHNGELIDKSDSGRKSCYDKNNSRNRDIYSDAKKRGYVVDMDQGFLERYIEKKQRTDISEEDLWIEKLDSELNEAEDTSNGENHT